ncbi:hypothetical protein Ancab_011822 [Ancistrocladus abbreviatus]
MSLVRTSPPPCLYWHSEFRLKTRFKDARKTYADLKSAINTESISPNMDVCPQRDELYLQRKYSSEMKCFFPSLLTSVRLPKQMHKKRDSLLLQFSCTNKISSTLVSGERDKESSPHSFHSIEVIIVSCPLKTSLVAYHYGNTISTFPQEQFRSFD